MQKRSRSVIGAFRKAPVAFTRGGLGSALRRSGCCARGAARLGAFSARGVGGTSCFGPRATVMWNFGAVGASTCWTCGPPWCPPRASGLSSAVRFLVGGAGIGQLRDRIEMERRAVGIQWDPLNGCWALRVERAIEALRRVGDWAQREAGVLAELEEFRGSVQKWPEVLLGPRGWGDPGRVAEHRLAKKLEALAGRFARAQTSQWHQRSALDWLGVGEGVEVTAEAATREGEAVAVREGRSHVLLECQVDREAGSAGESDAEGFSSDSGEGACDAGPEAGETLFVAHGVPLQGGGGTSDAGAEAGGGPLPARLPRGSRLPGARAVAGVEGGADAVAPARVPRGSRLPGVPWRRWLFADEPRQSGRCGARVWRHRVDVPVFGQCAHKPLSGERFCGGHLPPRALPHGEWRPADGNEDLLQSMPAVYELGVRHAKLRFERSEAMRQAEAELSASPGAAGAALVAGEGGGAMGGDRLHWVAPQGTRGVPQPPYVADVPESHLRGFAPVPEALPPFPCRLCDENFGTREDFEVHVRTRHAGWAEYRKRLFYLASSFEHVRPVTPQEWRQCVEAFTEHLVTGSGEWPAGVRDLEDAGEPSRWWCDAVERGPDEVPASPVNFAALGPAPANDAAEGGVGRRSVRHRLACAVCARLDWADRRELVHLWEQPVGQAEKSIIRDVPVPPTRRDAAQGAAAAPATAQTPRQLVAEFLSPERYWSRWRFAHKVEATGEVIEGGIPLAELEASAVRDPGPEGRLWLLHKKVFRFVERRGVDGRAEVVADPSQKVPVCVDCRCALAGRTPRMPKFGLANDLWIGRLPAVLARLRLGGRLLLPLARGLIRRYNCLDDSGRWKPQDQCIHGFRGNVVAYPQADGGKLVCELPPQAGDMVESVSIVLAGSDLEDLKKAKVEALGVTVEEFREAYDFMHTRNEQYARVAWDREGEEALRDVSGKLGLPSQLSHCTQFRESSSAQRMKQQGPADAVEGPGDEAEEASGGEDAVEEGGAAGAEEGEEGEFAAGIADADMQCDQDRQWKRVEVSLRRAELHAAEGRKAEAAVRAAMPETMGGYVDHASRAALAKDASDLTEALKGLNVERMRKDLTAAEQALEETRPPPGVRATARWAEGKAARLLVPTGNKPVSMFAPTFWSAFAPVAFPYGDGVCHLEREEPLSFVEWCRYLMDREELEYDPPSGEAPAAPGPLPRWRGDTDLLTAMYCLWRRQGYIKGARQFVRRQGFREALDALAGLEPEELYHACTILGRGAGLKDALACPDVSARVKSAIRSMLLCNANVVGSDAHRTVLRHVNNSYRLLFGAPLLFTTPNVADARSPVMSLVYEGATVCSWRLLEEHAPRMPSTEEMVRRVAQDPVGQAIVFNLMMELFLEHVLGVFPHGQRPGFSDGVAASGAVGAFGLVRAYLGPVETQGRGGLHPHMHVWLLHPVTAYFLTQVRAGRVEGLAEKLARWREAVLRKVASVQFESVEEFGRQLGLGAETPLPPLPLSAAQQGRMYVTGVPETDDLALPEAPQGSPECEAWVSAPPQGPRRLRDYAPVAPKEPDPQELAEGWPACRRVALTGAHLCLLPQYRRKPPYVRLADGTASVHVAEDARAEAHLWAECFFSDARLCFVRSHIHRCMNTCFKHAKGGEAGGVRVCRFNFHRDYVTVVFARRAPRRACARERCPMLGAKVVAGEHAGQPVHPNRCPAVAQGGTEWKRLRPGRGLVLPDGARVVEGDGSGEATHVVLPAESEGGGHYLPHVARSRQYGRQGRVEVLRYHPMASSTNPAGQVVLRCNWDVQLMDRVFVLEGSVCAGDVPGGSGDCAAGGGGGADATDEGASAAGLLGGGLLGVDDEEGDLIEEDEETLWGVGFDAPPEEGPLEVEVPSVAPRSLLEALEESLESMFRDAADSAQYTNDYATKAGPVLGEVFYEEGVGIERLRLEEAEAKAMGGPAECGSRATAQERLAETARKTAIRLATSANRALLKKLSEMCFQLRYGHECFRSHDTWTVFCKGLVWSAFRASRAKQLGATSGVIPTLDGADVEPQYPGDEDDEAADAVDVEEEVERGVFAVELRAGGGAKGLELSIAP